MSWETIQNRRRAGIEVSIISNFTDFKMSNDKLVASQVYEFLVGAIINIMPSSWFDYNKKLKQLIENII
jgi:hypothetical protein